MNTSDSAATHDVLPGIIYSSQLAGMFGHDPDSAIEMKDPLLGAALEIAAGITGANLCHLHLFIESSADIRLPVADSMRSIGAHVDQLPFAMINKPAGEVRKGINLQVRQLANRAIVRFGKGTLEMPVIASKDVNGTYTSFPLDAYDKNFVGGVAWIVMGINCAVAAEDSYDSVTMFFEKNSSEEGMIINQQIDPYQMTSIDVPLLLFRGMRAELVAATEQDEHNAGQRKRRQRVRVIGGGQ